MDEVETALVKQMIDDLDEHIETAKRQSYGLVERLLDMARIELLARYNGIEDREFEQFCNMVANNALHRAQ